MTPGPPRWHCEPEFPHSGESLIRFSKQNLQGPGIVFTPAVLWCPHKPGVTQVPDPGVERVQDLIIDPGETSKRVQREFREVDFTIDQLQVASDKVEMTRQVQSGLSELLPFCGSANVR